MEEFACRNKDIKNVNVIFLKIISREYYYLEQKSGPQRKRG
jgi:hypothetical protein